MSSLLPTATLKISSALHRRLKSLASQHGKKLQEFASDILSASLPSTAPRQKKERSAEGMSAKPQAEPTTSHSDSVDNHDPMTATCRCEWCKGAPKSSRINSALKSKKGAKP
jgi:hypothetical protein